MNSLLPQKEYKFKNITEEEYNKSKVFYFYCDNMQEGMHILFWLEKYNKEMILIKRGYNGISNYISMYNIDGEIYTVIICSYYHNGELPRLVRQIIYKIDKPDVVIYSKDEDKIICGIENTETAFVGNATWQRHGRIMNFLENDFPFVFFAYYSKKDNSQKTKRKPSPLFVLSFFALSIEKSTPAILSLYDHDDIEQNITNKDGSKMIDTRKESLSYILSLMRYGKESTITKEKLKKCFYDMKYYYKTEIERIKENELPVETLNLLRKNNFEDEVVEKIENKDKNYPLFLKGDKSNKFLFKWKPVSEKEYNLNNKKVGIYDYLNNQLNNIDFYQLSPKCPVGITFDTELLINRLNERKNTGTYIWEDKLDYRKPTVLVLLRLTKSGELSLPDPYNGRIVAFCEMYKQSFGSLNTIMYLMDHSNKNEYEVYKAKNMKIYKTINDYATMLIDRDLNIFDTNCDKVFNDLRSKYEEETTEDNVTCFFETILKLEDITPSFINPPCGSWSDLRLYPTDKFLYIKRNDDRPDIAYYMPKDPQCYYKDGTYFVGESKASYTYFKSIDKFNAEIARINRLVDYIRSEMTLEIAYKTFVIFKGIVEYGNDLVNEIREGKRAFIDYVVVIEEDNSKDDFNTKMIILEV